MNMAPQGFIKHSSPFEADLFSLPVKERKRKSQELNPNAPVFKRRKEKETVSVQEPEIVTIDSDTEPQKAKSYEVVTVSDSSDNESVKIYEPVELSDSDKDDCNNLVININQTENVDNIVDSALGRLVNSGKNNLIQNDAKKDDCVVEPVHWSQANGFPKSWTNEMIRFYAEPCEENRNFDYEAILNRMRTKPSDWWINKADMIGAPSRRKRSFEVCRKCDKFGHMANECRKNIVCYVCGGFNHRYPNCPNTLCLTCGKPASRNLNRCDSCDRAFQKKEPCGLCQQNSHEEFMCPSKWRKHLLLDPSNQSLRLNPNPFCYNCAQKGHFGFDCKLTPNSSYPLENPLITTFNMNSVILVPKETAALLHSEVGNTFLKRLSAETRCRIEFFEGGQKNYVRIMGDENQVRVFENELEKLKNNAR